MPKREDSRKECGICKLHPREHTILGMGGTRTKPTQEKPHGYR